MYSHQKFIKHIAIIGTINLLVVFQGIVILPIITKLLGVEAYGIWSQLRVTMNLLVPFVLLSLPAALIRFLPAEKNKKEIQEGVYSVLALVLGIALITALLLIIFSGPIANFFESQPILIKILSLVIILECLNIICLTMFQALREIKKYSYFVIFQTLVQIGLIIGAILLGYGLYGAVMSLLIIRVITFLLVFTYVLKRIGIKIPTFSPIKKYLRFSLPIIANHVSYWMITSIDRYLIGFFLGVLFVGYYVPAYSIGTILNLFLFPIAFILSVVLPKLFDEKKINEVKTYLRYSLKYFLVIVIPSAFGLSVLSKQLLTLLSTKEISANAYFVTPFILSSILIYGISYFFSEILILFKKTKLIAIIWAIAAVLNFVLNLIFVPIFGILAAAITTLLAYIVAFLLIWHFAFKELQFKIDWQFIIKSIIASVLMILFINWFNPTGLLNSIIAIILAVFVYAALIFLFKGFSKKEIWFFRDLMFQLKSSLAPKI